MLGRWDAKNNPPDYGIARNFGSGLKNPIGDLIVRVNVVLNRTPVVHSY